MASKLFLLLSIALAFIQIDAAHKCVWVTGILHCNKNEKHHSNVEVRIYDKDGIGIFQLIDPDDMMGVTFTEQDGSFKLDGCGDDFNYLPGVPNLPEPYITIKHYCNSEKGETLRLPEFDVFVPDTYDIGILVLDEIPPKEKPDEVSIPEEKPDNLPGDREPNRSVNTRFKPKHEQEASKSKETLTELHEILTKPDTLVDTK